MHGLWFFFPAQAMSFLIVTLIFHVQSSAHENLIGYRLIRFELISARVCIAVHVSIFEILCTHTERDMQYILNSMHGKTDNKTDNVLIDGLTHGYIF